MMNEEQYEKLLLDIIGFYSLLQRDIFNLISDNNGSELSPLLFKAIHEIHVNEGITPSGLSRRLSITVPNTSRCLHKLFESGYITKIKDKSDKRITYIKLSQKGLNLVQNSMELLNEMLLKRYGNLESAEMAKISEAFDILKEWYHTSGKAVDKVTHL